MGTGNTSQFDAALFGAPGVLPADVGTQASDLLYHAMRLARITQISDRVPSSPQYNDGMRAFRRMLNAWNVWFEKISTIRIDLWLTAPNKQTYTIGHGGDWDGTRPNDIAYANLLFPTSPTIRRKIHILDEQAWSRYSLQAVYTYPDTLFFQKESDVNSPLGLIWLRPIPAGAYQIELYTPQNLPSPFALTDLLIYPDGYEEAIVFNLAKLLMPMFPDRVENAASDALVIDEARASLARIRPAVDSPRIATSPYSNRRGTFNWATGELE